MDRRHIKTRNIITMLSSYFSDTLTNKVNDDFIKKLVKRDLHHIYLSHKLQHVSMRRRMIHRKLLFFLILKKN